MKSKEKLKIKEFLSLNLGSNKKYPFLLENPNFPYLINKLDLSYFSLIIKVITKTKLRFLKYLAKNNHIMKNKSKIIPSSKKFNKKQISLLFIYLFEFYNNDLLYEYLFKIIIYLFKNNSIFDNKDILEIINYNIIYNLIEMNNSDNILIYNKISLFNISLNYLIQIISNDDFQKSQIDIIFKILDSLYKFLNKKILFIFQNQTFNRMQKLSIIKSNEINGSSYFINNKNAEETIKINNKFKELLYLIYGFNINKNYNDYLLINLRNAFIELKGKNYLKQKIINSLYKINNQIDYINDIFLNEDKIIKENNKDKFMPRRYFIFNKSKKSGVNYNPKMSLISNNFTLIFSFKQYESDENKLYPLFTLINENDIIFGVYLKNKKLWIYFQNDYKNSAQTEIVLNKPYLIIIEFNKKNNLIELNINEEESKEINLRKIKCKDNTIVNIGYISEKINKNKEYNSSSNYIGIIGPILFLNNIIDDKDFISNVFKLQGFYDILLNLNANTFIYNDIDNHDINSLNNHIKNYFINISKIIEENLLFILTPLSLINDFLISNLNNCNKYTKTDFIENIYENNYNYEKNNLLETFSTLDAPLPFNGSTYSESQISSSFNFIKNDGFYIIILYFEYFYNILRMLISFNDQKENNNRDNSTIYYYINKLTCPVLNLLHYIIKQCANIMSNFKDSLDTLGFSMFKVFKLLINKTPLNSVLLSNFRQFLLNLNRIYIKTRDENSKKVIINFMNKILIMFCDKNFFDMNNYNEFNDYLSLFKLVLKNNEYLIDSNTLFLILNFTFILDKSHFEKIEEYKKISKEYKNLLKIFINQMNTMKLHCEYIQKVCRSEENNILIKYKLIKLYYIYNNIKYVYNQDNENDKKEKINHFFNIFKRNKNNNVYNILLKEKLFKEYKKQFNILINIKNNEVKDKNKKYLELLKSIFIQLIYEQSVLIIPSKLDINYLEANILLSDIQISFFKLDDIYLKKNYNRRTTKISRKEFFSFSIDDNTEVIQSFLVENENNKNFENIENNEINENKENNETNNIFNERYKRKNEKHKSVDPQQSLSIDKEELLYNQKSNNNIKVFGLFDELIMYEYDESLKDDIDISLYMFKSLFSCFYDKWNKDYKLKFIKDINDDSYESLNLCFNDFNRFKQKLFFQFIQLLEIINNFNLYEKVTKLIYAFIKQTINIYKSNQNDSNSRRIFIHLFENKIIMNFLLNICFNYNDSKFNINNSLKLYVESSITNIINNILILHPKPFIFSYIKHCIKNNKKNIIQIIYNISDFIIKDFKRDENINNSHITISFYYFNRIKFINTIKKCFKNYKSNSQILLCENDYSLFKIMQNLIEEFTKANIIFDSKIYSYNPHCLVYIYNGNNSDNFNEEEKKKDKSYIKTIQLNETKIINSEGIFIIIVELSLNIIYLLWTIKGEYSNFSTRMVLNDFISKISTILFLNEHLISYYIDLKNEFFTYNQPKKHDNLIRSLPKNISEILNNSKTININYKKYFMKNPYIKDNRILSIVVFLLFMKYKTMIINYEYKQNSFNTEEPGNFKEKVGDTFKNFIQKSLGDATKIYQNISKIKDDEKIKLFFAKEYKSNKRNWIKNTYQNYYKYLLDTIRKKQMYFVSENLINEIEKKYSKALDEEDNNKNNCLLEGKNYENILSPNLNDISYNNIEDINFSNGNDEQNKNKINENYKDEFQDQFTIIEKTMLIKDNIIDGGGNNDKNENKNEDNDYAFTNYFIDAKNQILCTKRDLILKNLAYFFYDDYFIDKNFIILKKTFMHLYHPNQNKNNYHNLEKLMSLDFPSTIKNYSNSEIYYPRIFLRPDKNFFNNKYFVIGHKYFKKKLEINKPNFEYGHGLLNQKSFDLFQINNDTNINLNSFYLNESYPCYETELISSNNSMQGLIILKEKNIIYQTNMNFDFNKYKNNMKYILSSKVGEMIQIPKQIIIPYKEIKQIIKRKFVFFQQALEVFLNNGKSYFFNLYKEELCKEFFISIENVKKNENNKFDFEIINEPYEYFFKKKYTSNWLDKKISTLEYLLKVNKFSGRTYNDLTQYLIFPWILKDYLDIYDKKYIRDFGLPMSVQEKEALEIVKENYELDDEPNKSYFKCHYSNSSYVTIYLFRINPFTNNQIKLQSGKFDAPQRQISCLQEICNIFKEHKETCELIPEYYYLIEIFMNMNFNFFGYLNKKLKNIVNNLKLPKDFDSLLELFLFHQNFLNSNEITSNIHKWIDNIYGENQITNKKNVINSFPLECYEQSFKKVIQNQIKELENNKDENLNIAKEINKIQCNLMQTYLLGQCPGQLFSKSHPQFSGKNIDNNYNKIYMKSDVKTLNYNDYLYMSESNHSSGNFSDNNNFYIVTNKEILVYNKQLKPLNNLFINIKKIYLIYDNNYTSNKEKENNSKADNILYYKQYFYKRLIFDIEDCKFFFIGGYLDNSYKIYFKNKEKTICYNYITNSIVTCMKYMKNTKIYFTGHIDGIIIKWKYNIIEKNKDFNINCSKISSIVAHRSGISLLQIHEKLELLLSASDKDGLIFIRKIYDYELLSVIKYNNLNKQIMDIIINKEYFVITYNYKKIINKRIQKIITYSVNGIKVSKINILNENKDNDDSNGYNLLPISLHHNNDNIFMFSKNKIHLIKITGKNNKELIPIDDIILKFINKGDYLETLNQIKSEVVDSFKEKLKNNIVVSYFYDFYNHLLFCLFNSGQMFRINLYPKSIEKNINK